VLPAPSLYQTIFGEFTDRNVLLFMKHCVVHNYLQINQLQSPTFKVQPPCTHSLGNVRDPQSFLVSKGRGYIKFNRQVHSAKAVNQSTFEEPPPQPLYGPFSGTTRVTLEFSSTVLPAPLHTFSQPLKKQNENCSTLWQMTQSDKDLRLSLCRQPTAWSCVSASSVSIFKHAIRAEINSLFFAR